MNIFPHSIAPLKAVDHQLAKDGFNIFYAVLTSQTPFQIAPECTI